MGTECDHRSNVKIVEAGTLADQGHPDILTVQEGNRAICHLMPYFGAHRGVCLALNEDHTSCPLARLHTNPDDEDARAEATELLLPR